MNAVTVLAVVKRATTQQVKIEFSKEGHGDDIVDQWADRILLGMKATVSCTVAQASKKIEAEMLRSVPHDDEAQRYYWVTYTCGNCRWVNMGWFLKGKPAAKSIACEKCECQTNAA